MLEVNISVKIDEDDLEKVLGPLGRFAFEHPEAMEQFRAMFEKMGQMAAFDAIQREKRRKPGGKGKKQHEAGIPR